MLATLALLVGDHVDGVFLARLVLADGGGLECADGCDGGGGAEARASASGCLEGGAGEEGYPQLRREPIEPKDHDSASGGLQGGAGEEGYPQLRREPIKPEDHTSVNGGLECGTGEEGYPQLRREPIKPEDHASASGRLHGGAGEERYPQLLEEPAKPEVRDAAVGVSRVELITFQVCFCGSQIIANGGDRLLLW